MQAVALKRSSFLIPLRIPAGGPTAEELPLGFDERLEYG